MPSPFTAVFAKRRVSVDAAFGEAVTVIPMTRGEYTRGTAAGTSFSAVAIVDMPEEIWRPAAIGDGGKSDLSVTQPQAEFALSEFGAGRPMVSEGFEILVDPGPSRPVQTRWRVLSVRPDGVSAIICALEKLS